MQDKHKTDKHPKTRSRTQVLLEERLSYRCSLISTRITRFVAPMLQDQYGLTVITWRVMAVIGRHGPLSAKEIALHTSTDAFFVFRAIEPLVKCGYVVRNIDSRDRRRSSLQLSAEGEQAHDRIQSFINAVESDLMSELDLIEKEALSKVLAHLNDRCAELLESDRSWQDYL